MIRRKRWYMETAGSQRFGGEIVNFSPVTLNGRTLNSCYAAVITLGNCDNLTARRGHVQARSVASTARGHGAQHYAACSCWLARPPRARHDRREGREGGAAGVAGESQQPRREHRDA